MATRAMANIKAAGDHIVHMVAVPDMYIQQVHAISIYEFGLVTILVVPAGWPPSIPKTACLPRPWLPDEEKLTGEQRKACKDKGKAMNAVVKVVRKEGKIVSVLGPNLFQRVVEIILDIVYKYM